MKVIVLKIAPYYVPTDRREAYGHYIKQMRYETSPSLDGKRADDYLRENVNWEALSSVSRIATATSVRAIQTASYIKETLQSNPSVIQLSALNEIWVAFDKMISQDEFVSSGSQLVRTRFIEAFENGSSTIEALTSLERRMLRLDEFLHQQVTTETLLCISHSFFMKCWEAYLHVGQELFQHRERIRNFISPNIRTYSYCAGFLFGYSNESLPRKTEPLSTHIDQDFWMSAWNQAQREQEGKPE